MRQADVGPLVGRDVELSELLRAMHAARAGRGGLWCVVGDAGAGKSRLVEELAAHAGDEGVAVHWGRCWEAGSTPPYWPWIQILRSIVAGADGAVPALTASDRLRLGQLLPELAAAGGETARSVPEPRHAQLQLLESVASLVAAAGQISPMLVVLEDVHAGDPSSLAILEYLARALRAAPVLLVATFRSGEEPAADAPLLRRLGGQGATLNLGPLNLDAIESLVGATREAPPDAVAPLSRALLDATGGNCLFVCETLRLLGAMPQLPASPDASVLPLPDSVRAAYLQRVEEAGPRARALLQVAAVLGRDVRASALQALTEMSDEATVEALGEAIDAGLLVEDEAGSYRFSHALCREAVYRALPSTERWELHRRAATWLQAAGAHDPRALWPAVATHLLSAGPASAVEAARAAARVGREATERLGFADAVRWYEDALKALAKAPREEPALRGELMRCLGRARIVAGEVGAGQQVCLEAATIAQGRGDAEGLARAALEYGGAFAPAVVSGELIALLQQALEALPRDDSPLRARLMARLAAASQPSRTPERPIGLAREAIAMARRVGDDETLLQTLRSAVSAMVDLGEPDERVSLSREHVSLAQRLDSPVDAWRALTRLYLDHLELGRFEEMDATMLELEVLARQLGHPYYHWPVIAFRGARAAMQGRFQEADAAQRQLQERVAQIDDASVTLASLLLRAGILRTRGDHERLSALIRDTPGALVAALDADFLHALWASDWARMGELDAVRRVMRTRDLRAAVDWGDLSVLFGVARLAVRMDDRALARAVLDRALERPGRLCHWGLFGGGVCDGPHAATLGVLEGYLGEPERAVGHFDEALALLQARGLRPLWAATAREAAEACAAAGDGARARALSQQAAELAAECGLDPGDGTTPAPGAPAPKAPAAAPEHGSALDGFSMHREGELWRIDHPEGSFLLKDTKGVQILARLVAQPGTEMHVLDLVDAPEALRRQADTGPAIDARARAEYRARAEAIRGELEEAEAWNDVGRAEALRRELEAIGEALVGAVGLGGRDRRTGSVAERARINAQRRIRDALRRIEREHPRLAGRLDRAVRTGTFCCYEPI
ncbi:MAG: AAA family ATPase [Myxococcales bacterium]|jgi:hypothetical protein